jgi:hypothetical protein
VASEIGESEDPDAVRVLERIRAGAKVSDSCGLRRMSGEAYTGVVVVRQEPDRVMGGR